jgi:hypothetical protein
MKHPIARTSNGVPVYVDLVRSQAAAHIAHQPHLLELVKELLQRTTVDGSDLRLDEDMGRNIGYSFVVETTEKDTILYAQPIRDDTYARFVKNGIPKTTQHLTVILKKDEDDKYELLDTWIGRLAPPRPGSTDETARSKTYWSNHAYVFDGQPIQLRTVTKVCPY